MWCLLSAFYPTAHMQALFSHTVCSPRHNLEDRSGVWNKALPLELEDSYLDAYRNCFLVESPGTSHLTSPFSHMKTQIRWSWIYLFAVPGTYDLGNRQLKASHNFLLNIFTSGSWHSVEIKDVNAVLYIPVTIFITGNGIVINVYGVR